MGLLYDYHVMLTLQFVKVSRGNVKKAGSKPCLFNYNIIPAIIIPYGVLLTVKS